MLVVSVVSGIFFKAKIEEAVKRVGTNEFHDQMDGIAAANPCVIVLDLEHPQALEVLKQYGGKVIAFGPHMKTELLLIGQKFGAKVYPRSIFFNQIDKLLHQRV